MIKIGLTGSRYSGKSSTARIFEHIGVPVFDADVVLKFIINFDIGVNRKILESFGEYIFTGPDSTIDPKKIRTKKDFEKLVGFADFELKRAYEKFRLDHKKAIYTIFHSSMLFERGWHEEMDFNINVFAPKDIRSARGSDLTGLPLHKMSEMMRGEMHELSKNAMSTYIIHNYESAEKILGELREQISNIDQKIIDKYLIEEHTDRIETT